MKLGFPLKKYEKKPAGCQPDTNPRTNKTDPIQPDGISPTNRQRTANLGGASSKAFKASAPSKAAVVEIPPGVPQPPSVRDAFVTVSDDGFWRGYFKICSLCFGGECKEQFQWQSGDISKNDGWRVIYFKNLAFISPDSAQID